MSKTKKREKKEELNRLYREEVLPKVLARDRMCQRCHNKRSEVGHHRKGRDGEQDGVNLTIYAPLIMGVCNKCHAYIHAHPEESYQKHWMYHRNRELPEGWQDYDYVLHPEKLAAFNDLLEDSK